MPVQAAIPWLSIVPVAEGRSSYNGLLVFLFIAGSAGLVALADQDDRWYPEKLATLVAARGEGRLVYSDMRVVDERDRVVSETFWAGRRNNFTNLGSLLLSNTVTGAASLFEPMA